MTPPTTTPGTAPPSPSAAAFDAFHAARARTTLVSSLYAAAMGEDYPAEVAASSSCDWPLLGLMTARLRMRPGQLLVDAGCGAGGIGLWLARALSVRLVGFDVSRVAVAQAIGRSGQFLPTGRAAFRVAGLEATGLPDGCAHGVVCVDALSRAADRDLAVRELGRVLAPGGRLVLTRALRRGAEPVWEEQARAAGLIVEHVDERPDEPEMWERLYRQWISHADELRRDLGDVQAESMLTEARRVLPALPGRRAVLLTLHRPATSPAAPGAVDTMTRPGRRPDDGPAPSERTTQ
ncbi:class I SAM-dependent methyltransferase [Streptomyces sp. NPDC091412]|uniref:class I SAM-dependent methyltransferase n=1 Tax=Streptomyces sp. NPDC091412 TaxID=3366002 RepID=UPI0038018176